MDVCEEELAAFDVKKPVDARSKASLPQVLAATSVTESAHASFGCGVIFVLITLTDLAQRPRHWRRASSSKQCLIRSSINSKD